MELWLGVTITDVDNQRDFSHCSRGVRVDPLIIISNPLGGTQTESLSGTPCRGTAQNRSVIGTVRLSDVRLSGRQLSFRVAVRGEIREGQAPVGPFSGEFSGTVDMTALVEEPLDWERSVPGRNIWATFSEARRRFPRGEYAASEITALDYEYTTGHVQGVTRVLTSNRFVLASSTWSRQGMWVVEVPGTKDATVFRHGAANHASPLQASGDLVIAPVTGDGEPGVYFLGFAGSTPQAIRPVPLGGVSPARSGIAWHPGENRHYAVVGWTLFRSNGRSVLHPSFDLEEVPFRKRVDGVDLPSLGGCRESTVEAGEGGVNLVYDQADDKLYVFAFYSEGNMSDRFGGGVESLVVQQISLLPEGYAVVTGCLVVPFAASPEGTSWRWAGGLKTFPDRIEIYKTDRDAFGLGNSHIATFSFPYRTSAPVKIH